MSLPPQSALKRSLSAALAGLLFAGPAAALPQGGQVVSGKAAISQVNPSTIQIQQFTANIVINWKGFSVGANELVRFLQPGAMSVAVNTVIGGSASAILGQITANGRIVLNNPAGITFGPGSLVNVGGLIATTLNMKDIDLASGRYVFQQGPGGLGTIINQGTLTAAPGGFMRCRAGRGQPGTMRPAGPSPLLWPTAHR
jgi:filamentous hemagglutinin family protein